MSKVYVLELLGDISNTPGSVTLEVGGVSTDKKVLENLKVQKDKELDEYFDDGEDDEEESDDDEDEDEDDFDDEDGEYCYMNYDLSSRPEWVIQTYDLLKK